MNGSLHTTRLRCTPVLLATGNILVAGGLAIFGIWPPSFAARPRVPPRV